MILAVALALAATVGFSSSAFAQYGYDDSYYEWGSAYQAHHYGYQNGYHDGYRKGQHEGRENDPGDINIRALQEATHGYRRWMGPVQVIGQVGEERAGLAGAETSDDVIALRRPQPAQKLDAPAGVHDGL